MIRYCTLPVVLAVALAAAARKPAKPTAPSGEPAYRTQVPSIEARSSLRKLPAPKVAKVTRDDYLHFIRRTWEGIRTYWEGAAGKPDVPHQGTFARVAAFFFLVEKDDRWLQLTLKFLRGDDAFRRGGAKDPKEAVTGAHLVVPAAQLYGWLRSTGRLAPADDEFCRQWLLLLDQKHGPFEYGAMNRSTGSAVGRAAVAKYLPQDPANPERRRYAQVVWDDWWKFRDTDENTTHYNASWLYYVTVWIELNEQENLYQDPEFKQFIYRYLAQASPLGAMPAFGDGCGWNEDPGLWIALYEKWARIYRDGRFKWLAHRLFQYTDPQEQEMSQWGNINHYTMDGLMSAWLWADESIPEQEPDLGSVVTQRKAVVWSSRDEFKQTGYFMRLTSDVIPNKLVFRTGWQPTDTYALVELCPPMGHGHSDAGSINCFISRGSVLLSDTPYLVKDHQFHNAFVVKPNPPPDKWRWEGDKLARMKVSVHDFQPACRAGAGRATRQAAFARVRIERYMDQPVTLDRRLFFLGDDGLWVHDTVEATAPYEAMIGPAWQTTGVHQTRGRLWVNTAQVTIPVAFIWELKYMMQWLNRPWDLLLWFAPGAGASVAVQDVTHDDTRSIVDKPLMNNFTHRVWCRKVAKLAPREPVRFSTLLVPHSPMADATPLAGRIEALLDTAEAAVLSLARLPDQRTLVGLNESGKPLQVGPIATDARWFLVRTSRQDAPRYWLVDATHLTLDDQKLFVSAERKTVDRLSPADSKSPVP